MIAELSPSQEDTELKPIKNHVPNLKSIFTQSGFLLEEAETTEEEDEESSCFDEDYRCDAIVRGICEMIEDDENGKSVDREDRS